MRAILMLLALCGLAVADDEPQLTGHEVIEIAADSQRGDERARDADYSPLWAVHIYDRRAFDLVHDASTALRARVVEHGPLVNCPIISNGVVAAAP